jgi:hypothetical protein
MWSVYVISEPEVIKENLLVSSFYYSYMHYSISKVHVKVWPNSEMAHQLPVKTCIFGFFCSFYIIFNEAIFYCTHFSKLSYFPLYPEVLTFMGIRTQVVQIAALLRYQ